MISIRYAIAADAKILLTIRRAAVLSCGNEHYSPEQLMAWAPIVNEATIKTEAEALNNRDRVTIIAVIDGSELDYSLNLANDTLSVEKTAQRSVTSKIVGLCTIGLSEALLKQCYVLPQYRGMGIAKGLVRTVESIAQSEGISSLKLSSSLIALNFYEKLGYRAIERYHYDLEGGLVMECVMMYKNI